MNAQQRKSPTSHRGAWLTLAGALTLAAAICLVMWGAAALTTASPPLRPNHASASPAISQASRPVEPATQRLPSPLKLSIPRIAVVTRLTSLGLQADGTVQVPVQPMVAGWYDKGPLPGARGSSVILGHVDSVNGPAVFYRLRELQPGDKLFVTLSDGTVVQFVVDSTQTYLNDDFPAQKVYGRQGRPELNLVTCGGAYDKTRGGYQANLVVNARRI